MQKKIIALLAGAFACSLLAGSADAQTGSFANIKSLYLDDFPQVIAFVDVRNPEGSLVSGLGPGDFTIIENGLSISPEQVAETQTGVQLVVALNTATPFGIQNEEGITRYDLIAAALGNWASSVEGSASMDLSLVLPNDSPVVHTSDAALWRDALANYQPNYQISIPTLDVLSRAVNIAGDEPPQAGMARVIFFITPALDQNFVTSIQEIADQAGQTGLQIFVLLVDAPSLFTSVSGFELQRLAEQAGGRFFTFSGFEPLPDFALLFEDVGRAYRLIYRSMLANSGSYEITAVIGTNEAELTSNPYTFDLQLLPPNAILLSPPAQIARAFPEQSGASELVPDEQAIEIIIEFPDGIERELVRTSLYANGQLAAENNAPPFDRFIWDLTTYTSSEQVFLRVEVEDELGLVGVGAEVSVQVSVQRAPEGARGFFNRFGSSFVVIIALLTGGVLLLILLLGGRIRPRKLGQKPASRAVRDDPVTEPILPSVEEAPARRWFDVARRISRPGFLRPREEAVQQPDAYLARIASDGEPLAGEIFPVMQAEITFGRDPDLATVVLDDPAIESVHARLWQNGEGIFYLADKDSIAGSWVNYEPVSDGGRQLKHGDVLHIGSIAFRFTLKNPAKMRRPQITPARGKNDTG